MGRKIENFFITITSLGAVGTCSFAGTMIANMNINDVPTITKYNNVISNTINNYDQKVNDKFVKGVDASSYAEILENCLFENNVKKQIGQWDYTWYTYEDFDDTSITVWDDKTNSNVTLEQYTNNHIYSYIDENGKRVYDNLFSILIKKGFNSLRLKIWVNPFDENNKSFGGGHNDLKTTIFIIKQAKKYGFNDFLLDFQYSDFWSDPAKSYIPNSWKNLTDTELLQKSYDYTYDCLKQIYEQTGVAINRIQYGNEIDSGFLWKYNNKKFEKKQYSFLADFIRKAVKATDDFTNKYGLPKIDKGLHFACSNQLFKYIDRYHKLMDEMDTLYISSYIVWGSTFAFDYEKIETFKKRYPNKKIMIGETSTAFDYRESEYINDATKIKHKVWNPELQALNVQQNMQLWSKMLPNIETGIYFWEIGQLYIGRLSWASKEGMEYYQGNKYKTWRDINNWSQMAFFDQNGLALPSLDVIKEFKRNIDPLTKDVFDTKNYFDFIKNRGSEEQRIFYEKINFIWSKNYKKVDLENFIYDKNNKHFSESKINLELYFDNVNLSNIDLKKLEEMVIEKIKTDYRSLMFTQIKFSNFNLDKKTGLGSIQLTPNSDSFYYTSKPVVLNFKVHENYLSSTIDLTNNVINMSKSDNNWSNLLINNIKNSGNDIGTEIWNYLKISGGINNDNNFWLYDNNKQADRNAEYFLLSRDNIRHEDNIVESTMLDKYKFWINNFNDYSTGEHDIYFGIKKGLNDINWEYNTPSTFSLVGKESWKNLDLLVYKLRINLS